MRAGVASRQCLPVPVSVSVAWSRARGKGWGRTALKVRLPDDLLARGGRRRQTQQLVKVPVGLIDQRHGSRTPRSTQPGSDSDQRVFSVLFRGCRLGRLDAQPGTRVRARARGFLGCGRRCRDTGAYACACGTGVYLIPEVVRLGWVCARVCIAVVVRGESDRDPVSGGALGDVVCGTRLAISTRRETLLAASSNESALGRFEPSFRMRVRPL